MKNGLNRITCKKNKNYTVISNVFLQDVHLTTEAKGFLAMVMTLPHDWDFSIAGISTIMPENPYKIRKIINELKEHNYCKTKQLYNDKNKFSGIDYCFYEIPFLDTCENDDDTIGDSRFTHAEIGDSRFTHAEIGDSRFTHAEIRHTQNLPQINTYRKKVLIEKNKHSSSDEEEDKNTTSTKNSFFGDIPKTNKITSTMFDKFWKLYPRHVDKGKAFTAWKKLCSKKDKPTWKEISKAILTQTKSERWQDKKYIPHPTTWLNQNRWLDDANEMTRSEFKNSQKQNKLNNTTGVSKERQQYFEIIQNNAKRVSNM